MKMVIASALTYLTVFSVQVSAQTSYPRPVQELQSELKTREEMPLIISMVDHYVVILRLRGTDDLFTRRDTEKTGQTSDATQEACIKKQLAEVSLAEASSSRADGWNCEIGVVLNQILENQRSPRKVENSRANGYPHRSGR